MTVQEPYDLFLPAFVADPYPIYDRLRAEQPVYRHPQSGRRVFTRYDDVDAILRDPGWSANRLASFLAQHTEAMQEELRPLFAVLTKQFLFLDPPNHVRLRGLVSKAFTPRVVEGLRRRIEQLVNGLLTLWLPTGSVCRGNWCQNESTLLRGSYRPFAPTSHGWRFGSSSSSTSPNARAMF
jgi:cytochrome P450